MAADERTRADTESVDAIIRALYEGISGPAGERDWDRCRALMLPGARMIPTGMRSNGEDRGVQVMDYETFIASTRSFLSSEPFYEVEIARTIERFGAIVHVFSTYESRHTPTGEPFVRGINSIQLLHKDGRYWVVTVFWANESPGQSIPDSYLP